MSLTITMPNKPSFIKDGINISISTNTTGVEAHYIIVEIIVNSETITARQPVIEGKSIFNIAELINSKSDKIFDFNADEYSNSSNQINWRIIASEVYNYDSTLINTTPPYSGLSYRGTKGIHKNNKFLTNYRKKIIHRSECILLFFNINNPPKGDITAKISFNDIANTIRTHSIYASHCTQILIIPEKIPKTATEVVIEIENYSEQILFKISDFNIIDKETFVFLNSFGVYDTISFFAHKEIKDNYSFEIFRGINKEQKFNSLFQEEITKATYLLHNQFENDDEVIFNIREFYTSEEVYLVSKNNETIPIIITDNKRPIYDTQEQMYLLEITYKKLFRHAGN